MESTTDTNVSDVDEKTFTLAEVKQHKDAKSLWIAIGDNVYDVTKFMEEVNANFWALTRKAV